MENEHGQKLKAHFDGYSVNYDINKTNDLRISRFECDVERLTFEHSQLKPSVH